MEPLQWMGAIRMRIQIADENIKIITQLQSINKDLLKQKAAFF